MPNGLFLLQFWAGGHVAGTGASTDSNLIDAMNHEAIILTQQDAKMAFSPPVWGGVAYARGASGAPNLNDALSHDAGYFDAAARRADAFDAAIQGSHWVSRTTRWTTLVPTPSVLAILRMPSPLARCSLMVASTDGLTLRRPSFVPF
jgi:hypothetical protein